MSLTRRYFIGSAFLASMAATALRGAFAQRLFDSREATFGDENLSLLNDATEKTFQPFVGDSFTVSQGGRRVGTLTLHSVASAPKPAKGAKVPMVGKLPPSSSQEISSFSLQFKGSGTPLQQGTYTLKNSRLGTISLFIVPGGEKSKPYTYTAVFCTLA